VVGSAVVAAHEVLQVVECIPHSRGWQQTALVQSAASSHGSVMPPQPAVNAVQVPASPARQHCDVLVSQLVLPHATIIGVLGAPPSGTGAAAAPLELPPPSPVAPPSPPAPELLGPVPPLDPSASASSPPPLELCPPLPPLLPPPLLPPL
jgi:hypothetical protein